jgi:hypothetical protein
MNKEILRMQMLAGIITEGQYKETIEENNIEGIDVSQVKDLLNDPIIKKMSSQLKADPKALKNVIKFISDHKDDKSPLDEFHDKFSLKQKLTAMLTSAGIPSVLGGLFGLTLQAGSTHADMNGLICALTAAVIGLGVGALTTAGFKRSMFEEEEDLSVEDQIQKIVDLGKSM